MNNLIRFFIKFHVTFLFILLQGVGLILLIQSNSYQKAKFVSFTHNITGKISQTLTNFKDYITLRKENRELIEENNKLYNLLKQSYRIKFVEQPILDDSIYFKQFEYIGAKVVNNTTNKTYNYILLNKGKKDGIEYGMGVVTVDGIVGTIFGVSENFSSVLPVLNMNFNVSAKIKRIGYSGNLSWNGRPNKAILGNIPHHADLRKGDTVITSQYSGIFPEGFLIGKISNYKIKGGNFFRVEVELFTNFHNLNQVQVIKNKLNNERRKIENIISND